jgi:hypothetical protein
MRLVGVQKLLLILLLLAFNCQSMLVAAQVCPMQLQNNAMSTPAVQSVDMSSMGHSMDAMDAMDNPRSAEMMMDHSSHAEDKKPSCCKQMGHCLLGGCTVIGPSYHFDEMLAELSSTAAYSYNRPQPIPLASSLFRPPKSD